MEFTEFKIFMEFKMSLYNLDTNHKIVVHLSSKENSFSKLLNGILW